MPHVFYLAPTGRGVGLTSVSLGLVRALDREGIRVGFCKLVGQPGAQEGEQEHSSYFIRQTTHLEPPEPLPYHHVESLMSAGESAQLLEEMVELFEQSAQGVDVVVVEGLVGSRHESFATTLNTEIVRTLGAEVILVGTPAGSRLEELNSRLEIAARLYGGLDHSRVLGAVLNKVGAPVDARGAVRGEILSPQQREPATKEAVLKGCSVFAKERFRLLGFVPWQQRLVAPRTVDVVRELSARVLHEGALETRRVEQMALCARSVANMVEVLTPGTLIVTPGDRDDIIVASCMAALNGVPLAGLLLTSGYEPDGRIMKLCERAVATGLPILLVAADSYTTAALCAEMNTEVPPDDLERIDMVMDSVAEHLNVPALKERLAEDIEPRLSPAAFQYRLVHLAREASKRVVLPEGSEARTVKAAAICQERGIAQCALLGQADEIRRVADAQGVKLPKEILMIDPEEVRGKYVTPLVELRKHKGVTPQMAETHLEDNVVLGTMMLALDEVDGLVSGAIHTTANTVRPALQLVKTAPDAKLVSSIFFMCLPEQVLIYGDCAINPDPSAEELADIAIQSAASAEAFGIPPRVAMISYSTGTSGEGVDVEKVREATRIAKELRPDLLLDGPLQYDAATTLTVAKQKAPESPVAGRATVLIFPDLNTGNTTYKAVQRSAGVVSIGPMLQGLRKPVNDLSRGALVDDIVYTIALTAIQAGRTRAG